MPLPRLSKVLFSFFLIQNMAKKTLWIFNAQKLFEVNQLHDFYEYRLIKGMVKSLLFLKQSIRLEQVTEHCCNYIRCMINNHGRLQKHIYF